MQKSITYYNEKGYIHFRHFFNEETLNALEGILLSFHSQWLQINKTGYETGLINSHSLTSSSLITPEERLSLFKFITQDKLEQVITAVFPDKPLFLNTQLFFDPLNKQQQNYWHRDIQYTGIDIEAQKEALRKQYVIHFRIPLKNESGIELIPGSHTNWDNEEELETRLALNGRKPYHNLKRGKTLPLNRGDLLVFSAHMIHRGLYGNDRFAFDILCCDDNEIFRSFIDENNHPKDEERKVLKQSALFR